MKFTSGWPKLRIQVSGFGGINFSRNVFDTETIADDEFRAAAEAELLKAEKQGRGVLLATEAEAAKIESKTGKKQPKVKEQTGKE